MIIFLKNFYRVYARFYNTGRFLPSEIKINYIYCVIYNSLVFISKKDISYYTNNNLKRYINRVIEMLFQINIQEEKKFFNLLF